MAPPTPTVDDVAVGNVFGARQLRRGRLSWAKAGEPRQAASAAQDRRRIIDPLFVRQS